MTHFGERLKALALQLGKEDQDVAHDLGLSKAQMSHYTTGKRKVPSELLQKIVDIYGLNPQFLFDEKAPLYSEYKEENEQVSFLKENTTSYETLNSTTSYPYYPVSVAAGLPSNIDYVLKEDVQKITLPNSVMGRWAKCNDIFFLKANGESMNKIFPDGSLIAIKKIELLDLKDGDIVVFSNGSNEFSVKRLLKDIEGQRYIFRPESSEDYFTDYSVSFTDSDSITIHGKVVVYISTLD
ncbi:XRE family transcriptional regulator [Viridibacillus arvi]|uniref:XRE family transcriptional regulator n=1 Tax=Viridibacillus arvi TaxID=263475 RepID=UPI003D2E9306